MFRDAALAGGRISNSGPNIQAAGSFGLRRLWPKRFDLEPDARGSDGIFWHSNSPIWVTASPIAEPGSNANSRTRYPMTRCARCSEIEIVASLPELKSMKSNSMPSLKITPPCPMRDETTNGCSRDTTP